MPIPLIGVSFVAKHRDTGVTGQTIAAGVSVEVLELEIVDDRRQVFQGATRYDCLKRKEIFMFI